MGRGTGCISVRMFRHWSIKCNKRNDKLMKIELKDVSKDELIAHYEETITELQSGLEAPLQQVYVDGLNRVYSSLGLEAIWDDRLCEYRIIYA